MTDRCGWAGASDLMIASHDREGGVPLHDDRRHFEFLLLDGFQAGLSWAVIVNKREGFRRAFDGFDPEKIARYRAGTIGRLLKDPGIVRNRQKIEAAVRNARAFLELQESAGSFDAFVWEFVGGATKHNARETLRQNPARTKESYRLSRAVQERGLKFVCSSICYAHLQAAVHVDEPPACCV